MHLIDTTMFFCARSGGVKRYLLAKHDWLTRRAPHVRHTLLVPAPHARSDYIQTVDAMSLALIDGYRLPLDFSAWRQRIIELQPDLIEAADPYVPGWAARAASQQLGVPAVAFYHSDMPRMIAQRVGGWIAPICRSYLRKLYQGFDLVLAPSRIMYQQLIEAGIARVRLQPLGVHAETFTPERADRRLRQRLIIPDGTRLLVYAGRLAKEKNIPMLLQAARMLGDGYHLLIVGARSRERIERNVTLLPYQRSAQKLARVLASCDAFVHAGDSETYGLIIVEAMACGLPVVAGHVGALPELVDENVGVLTPRLSAADIASGVSALFSRDLATLQRQARERVLKQHAWDAVLPRLMNHYESITATRPRATLLPAGSVT